MARLGKVIWIAQTFGTSRHAPEKKKKPLQINVKLFSTILKSTGVRMHCRIHYYITPNGTILRYPQSGTKPR